MFPPSVNNVVPLYHWYVKLSPVAVTPKVALLRAHALASTGSTVITVEFPTVMFTSTLVTGVFGVPGSQVPDTITL